MSFKKKITDILKMIYEGRDWENAHWTEK